MDIYTLLRILVYHIQPQVHSPAMDASVRAWRKSALDLIDKLEQTQALGTLASQLEGDISEFMPNV